MFDPTVTIGNLLEIATIIGGGVTVMIRLNTNVIRLTANFTVLSTDMTGMQAEIKEMRKVLTEFAITDTKMDALASRVTNTEVDIRDLRKGRGFIQKEIDKEW